MKLTENTFSDNCANYLGHCLQFMPNLHTLKLRSTNRDPDLDNKEDYIDVGTLGK